MEKKFTITVFTEDHIGLINRITSVFARRHLNITSLTTSESEIQGVFRFTIVIHCTEDLVIKVVKQLEKQVEIITASYHVDDELIHQEIALYKISTKALADDGHAERIIREYNARVLTVNPEFTVIEKTGHKKETQALLSELRPFGVMEFVRSGRVAITKQQKDLSEFLAELEEE